MARMMAAKCVFWGGCLVLGCLNWGICREGGDASIPCGVGFYGSPAVLWEKGLRLPETGANAVVVGYEAITADMVERCHSEGARIFADFGVFVGSQIAEQHPELWPIGAKGKTLEKEGWYLGLCPAYEWYKEGKLAQIREFLHQTPVDGVYLDFIRWPCYWEAPEPRTEQSCFCDNALSLFSQDRGVRIYGHTTRQKARYILRHHREKWGSWKAEQITSFVRQVRAVIEATRPEALLGLFVVPWRREEYDNAIIGVIGQDFPALAQYVDVFSPMVYYAMCKREIAWVGEYSNWLAEDTGKTVWPIVQATNDPCPVSADELAQVLHEALSGSARGVLVFTLDALLGEPQKLEVTKKAFSRFPEKEGSQ